MSQDVLSYLESKGMHLRRAGGWEHNTPCVYCNEDLGSRGRLYINVDPEADIPGLHHCFLCDAKGNLTTLKKHFGDDTSITDDDLDSLQRSEILNAAAAYYHDQLDDFTEVFAYLRGPQRGLTIKTIGDHRLGYAPMEFEWDVGTKVATVRRPRLLYRFLRDEGFETKDILATGLVHDYEGKLSDTLAGMVTIPYRVAGNVVMIRGRAWPYDDADWNHWEGARYSPGKAKYKTPGGNSTRLFNSDISWNSEEVYLAEGEFDALVLTQHGFPAMGVPGASSWQESWNGYLATMKRVWLVFDRDQAGEKGAAKLAEKFGMKVRAIHLSPEGVKCDPTQWFAEHGHTADEFEVLVTEAGSGGLLVSVREAMAEFVDVQGQPGLKFGYELMDLMLEPGLQGSQIMILLAKTGCLTGDTEIAVNRAGKGFKMRLDTMHQRWTGAPYRWDRSIPTRVQSANDGVIKLNEVEDIWDSGIKPVFELRTNAGRTIKATAKHPFLTPQGWVKLGDLDVGSEVFVNAGRSVKGRTKKSHYHYRSGLIHHPFRNRRNVKAGGNSVFLHRLVIEANLNRTSLADLLTQCRLDPSAADTLTFLDPEEYVVHHVDHDPHNNELDNLEILTHEEHAARHAEEGTGSNVLEQVGLEEIESITFLGDQQTYDISMKAEPHNFLANGFVVHNTGKTIWLLNAMHRMRRVRGQENMKILFVSLEQTRGEWWDRARRIHRFYSLDSSEEEAAQWWENNLLLVDKNRLNEGQLRQILDDFAYQMGQLPDLVCLDYLGYWARSFKGEAYERTSSAAMALKAIAKDYKVPIIVPHQVSRIGRDGEEFGGDAARDSGVIEETADFLLTIWSPDNTLARSEEEKTGQLHMRIAKSRHGGRGVLLSLQFAPVSLVMVPQGDPLVARARQEFIWRSMYRDDWEKVLYRHNTGFEGVLDMNNLPRPDSQLELDRRERERERYR